MRRWLNISQSTSDIIEKIHLKVLNSKNKGTLHVNNHLVDSLMFLI